MVMTHFDTRYDLRMGTDEEKNHVKKIKGELAETISIRIISSGSIEGRPMSL